MPEEELTTGWSVKRSGNGRMQAHWQQWYGGSCPIRPDAVVEVRHRYAPGATAPAAQFRWTHDQYYEYGAYDIIAYRVIRP